MIEQPEPPKSNYVYKVISCPTPEALQNALKKHKDKVGFYHYFIPQAKGCLLVIATADLKAIQQKTTPKVLTNMKLLTEGDSRNLLTKVEYVRSEDLPIVDNFITWLYENSLQIVKNVAENRKEE